MMPPKIETVVTDMKNKITVRIFSYRKLKGFEIDSCLAGLHKTAKKLKKNTVYTVSTLFGADNL
ncbi:MAG: hypothetical protein HYY49_09495 [Ignavibacteriales bacterium]|nr:hypothetical protein [Ignavibacteriales bacterium]